MLDGPILLSSSGPTFAKKLFNSVTMSSGSVLSFMQFNKSFLSVFLKSRFNAFHNQAESPFASCIEFWKKSLFSCLLSYVVLFAARRKSSCSFADSR